MSPLHLLSVTLTLGLLLCAAPPSTATPTHRHIRLTPESTTVAAAPSAPTTTRQPIGRSTETIAPHSTRHPSKGTLANLQLDPAIDCAFRSVAIEVVTARQPSDAFSNWTALAESAFQMEQCSNYSLHTASSTAAASSFQPAPTAPQPAACAHELFVDAERGVDTNAAGSASSPFQSVNAALTALRQQRKADAQLATATACITLRGGRHYLGGVSSASQPVTSSRIGAIHLTAADSNLVLQGAQGEQAVLSGGVELGPLNWTVWKSTAAGDIMQATLPPSIAIDGDQFNELYIDGVAAVRAKYPNGNQLISAAPAPLSTAVQLRHRSPLTPSLPLPLLCSQATRTTMACTPPLPASSTLPSPGYLPNPSHPPPKSISTTHTVTAPTSKPTTLAWVVVQPSLHLLATSGRWSHHSVVARIVYLVVWWPVVCWTVDWPIGPTWSAASYMRFMAAIGASGCSVWRVSMVR